MYVPPLLHTPVRPSDTRGWLPFSSKTPRKIQLKNSNQNSKIINEVNKQAFTYGGLLFVTATCKFFKYHSSLAAWSFRGLINTLLSTECSVHNQTEDSRFTLANRKTWLQADYGYHIMVNIIYIKITMTTKFESKSDRKQTISYKIMWTLNEYNNYCK